MDYPQILVIEDNEADIFFITEGFYTLDMPNMVHVVKTGADALDFLFQRNRFANAPRPDLVLLDLYLPQLNGKEILKTIKTNTKLKAIPVVVFTASENASDYHAAYKLQANSFILKPKNLVHYMAVLAEIKKLWLSYPN